MASNLYIRDLCNRLHKLDINDSSINTIKHTIQQKCSIPINVQQLWHNGKVITTNTLPIISPSTYTEISLSLSLNGGKGGFGSMLRAAGKLNKTTNKSAMRDLSGRRYRFVQQENELREWIINQKTNKPISQREIQDDFRHIKQHGILPEKRMCHRGINCRYRNNCKFRHPDDIDPYSEKKNKKKTHKKQINISHQTNEEMRNALLMGKLNAKANAKAKINAQNTQKLKKIIPLFGDNEFFGDINGDKNDKNVIINCNKNLKKKSIIKAILHDNHEHKLSWIIRGDCDFVICDFCAKQYVGPTWHCSKGCDFDLCDDCVVLEDEFDSDCMYDKHLNKYVNESHEMKEIIQKDAEIMNIKSFSNSVCRKRKRQEKKLGLLGLESVKRKVNVNDKEEMDVGIGGNKLRKDTNEILIEEDKKKSVVVVNDIKGDIDLNGIGDVNELKEYGMDKLKIELQLYGLKCGGTLEQRADRLFLLKNNKLNDLPKNCFVSKKKKKIKKPPRKKQKIAD